MASNTAHATAVKERVTQELLRRPGVVGVGLGAKLRNGMPTGELAIVVSVLKKKPLAELASEERLPESIDGVAVDVEERAPKGFHQEIKVRRTLRDHDKYRKPSMEAGSAVSVTTTVETSLGGATLKTTKSAPGTLGCFAITSPPDPQVVALTCHHVVQDEDVDGAIKNFPLPAPTGAAPKHLGRKVGQPSSAEPSFCSPCCNDFFGKVFDSILSDQVDGAIVCIDPGVKYTNVIRSAGAITGTQRIRPEDPGADSVKIVVQKRGERTFYTRGYVREVDKAVSLGGGQSFLETLEVIACPPFRAFSAHGDSGSAVLDLSGNMVGLLFAGPTDDFGPPATSSSNVCRIDRVLSQLQISVPNGAGIVEVPNTNHPNNSPRPGDHVAAQQAARAGAETLERAYDDLLATPVGRDYLAAFRRNQEELIGLVQRNRRVAATWRRRGGPAMLREGLACLQNRNRRIPPDLDGTDLSVAVTSLMAVLGRYATPQLRSDLEAFGPALANVADMTFDQLIERMGSDTWPSR